ncbi:hypothetical protein [Paraburkholderia fungorum]|nr:hypothetical protein [Paraburkholderia fungorum]
MSEYEKLDQLILAKIGAAPARPVLFTVLSMNSEVIADSRQRTQPHAWKV